MAMFLWSDPNDFYRPVRRLEEDVFSPVSSLLSCPFFRPGTLSRLPDVGSDVTFDKDKFQANVDVQHFKPEEISVKVTGDNVITIEGQHEEKPDEHGSISRHFVRRYVLPEGHDVNQVQSKLSSDGVLTITAPKIPESGQKERAVPITQTGLPSKPIENVQKKPAQ